MAGESQKVVNVIRQAIDQSQSNGAQIQYTPGVVDTASGYFCSAYVWVDELLEDIIVPTSEYVNAGDYAIIGISPDKAWVERVLPQSLYAKMVIDYNNNRIGFGTGATDISDFGTTGQAIVSDGAGGAEWGTAPSDHTKYTDAEALTAAEAGLSTITHHTKPDNVTGTRWVKMASGSVLVASNSSVGVVDIYNTDRNSVDTGVRARLWFNLFGHAGGQSNKFYIEGETDDVIALTSEFVILINSGSTPFDWELYGLIDDSYEHLNFTPTISGASSDNRPLDEPVWHDAEIPITPLPTTVDGDAVVTTLYPVLRDANFEDVYLADLYVSSEIIHGGDLRIKGTDIGLVDEIYVDGTAKVMRPWTTDTHDLGAPSNKFKDLHLSGDIEAGGALSIGGDILPSTASAYDVGSVALPFDNIHVNTINVDNLEAIPYHFRWYRSTTQSVANNAAELLFWNSETFDTTTGVTPDDDVILPRAGYWYISATVAWEGDGNNSRSIVIDKNTTEIGQTRVGNAGGAICRQLAEAVADFNGTTDTVRLDVLQNSGGALDIQADDTWLYARWLGPAS